MGDLGLLTNKVLRLEENLRIAGDALRAKDEKIKELFRRCEDLRSGYPDPFSDEDDGRIPPRLSQDEVRAALDIAADTGGRKFPMRLWAEILEVAGAIAHKAADMSRGDDE